MTRLVSSEAQVKRDCEQRLQIAKNQGKLLYHRLNAGMIIVKGKSESEKEYAVRNAPKGTADFIVELPALFTNVCTYFRVIYIELKKPGGEQSEAQAKFQKEVEDAGAEYYLVESVEELERILKE